MSALRGPVAHPLPGLPSLAHVCWPLTPLWVHHVLTCNAWSQQAASTDRQHAACAVKLTVTSICRWRALAPTGCASM
jgi:hypothetical protein